MANISFKRGTNLNNLAIADGQFIVNTAERSIYVDVGTERLRIGDFISVASTTALPADANTTALYYIEDINCLARWTGAEWKQINRDTGAVTFTVTGTGNAITSVDYNADSRTLTLTKGETFATPAVVDSKIDAKVGELKIGETSYDTVKAYVDQKTSGIATDAALSELTDRVTAAEGDIDNLQAAIAEGGSVANAIADAKKAGTDAAAALDAYKETNDAAVQANASAISAINNETTGILAQAKAYADGKDAAISAAQDAADAAQADVDALEAKVGAVTEGKTVVQMISEAQAAATYDDTAVKASIKAIADDYLKAADKTELQGNIDIVSDKVDVLVGNVEGDDSKSARTIASEEVAKIVAGADTAYDTLKEISDWISSHKTDAAAMNSAIVTLEGIVDGIGGEGEKATVVAYVTDAIAALKIGDYAKAADLLALTERVVAMENKVADWDDAVTKEHEHANKALLDTYTQTEADLADAVSKKHSHANATELDKIVDGDVAKWNAAEANAKSYADGIVADEAEIARAAEQANATAISEEITRAKAAEKANSDAIAVINGTGDGSFAKADATLKTQLEAYADQAETDAIASAKNYTDGCLEWGEF